MKTRIALTLVIIGFLPMALMAHAPKKVELSYDKETNKLTIEMPHPVKNVETHFIESITISINGEENQVLEYTKQSSEKTHQIEVELSDVKTGDEITVKGACNKMGSKSSSLTID